MSNWEESELHRLSQDLPRTIEDLRGRLGRAFRAGQHAVEFARESLIDRANAPLLRWGPVFVQPDEELPSGWKVLTSDARRLGAFPTELARVHGDGLTFQVDSHVFYDLGALLDLLQDTTRRRGGKEAALPVEGVISCYDSDLTDLEKLELCGAFAKYLRGRGASYRPRIEDRTLTAGEAHYRRHTAECAICSTTHCDAAKELLLLLLRGGSDTEWERFRRHEEGCSVCHPPCAQGDALWKVVEAAA